MIKRQCILCVDDEKVVLNSLKDQLKLRLGNAFSIEVAESGEDALDIFNELISEDFEIPLVISDYIMPGMKGDELLEKIHQTNPDTFKILLTGQATLEGLANIINRANLYRYISKPWDIEDLSLAILEAIKGYEKDRMIEAQNEVLKLRNNELIIWTESFVEAMGKALDLRDTTTAGHSQRIAEYAQRMARAINDVDYGVYANYRFTEEEIRELYYAALLHDIGKMGVREHILLKRTKVSSERLSLFQYRFYLLKSQLSDEHHELKKELDLYYKMVEKISGSESIGIDETVILNHLKALKYIDIDQKEKNLIDEDEYEQLSVLHGNLTAQERQIMQTHAELTYDLLKGIPWPEHLKNVPIIASNHHERLNGAGYYKGLKADEIILQSRILAILDIYEALTAPDRPYRGKKTVVEALEIIQKEVDEGFLDSDLYEIFLKEKLFH